MCVCVCVCVCVSGGVQKEGTGYHTLCPDCEERPLYNGHEDKELKQCFLQQGRNPELPREQTFGLHAMRGIEIGDLVYLTVSISVLYHATLLA